MIFINACALSQSGSVLRIKKRADTMSLIVFFLECPIRLILLPEVRLHGNQNTWMMHITFEKQ